MTSPLAKKFRLLTLVAAVLFAAAFLWYEQQDGDIADTARQTTFDKVKQAAAEMETSMNRLVPVNIAISEALTSGALAADEAAIMARLEQAKAETPEMYGVGVAYKPFQFDPERRLYAPLYVEREGGPQLVRIEDIYDYTEEGRDWYHLPLEHGPIWQEPHYGQASQVFLANFTAPFFTVDPESGRRVPNGVVYSSMSFEQYRGLIAQLGFGDVGYGFLLSKKGAFLGHPDDTRVLEKSTIMDWADEANDPQLTLLSERVLDGRRTFIERKDSLSGKTEWIFTEPMVGTGWTLGVVIDRAALPGMGQVDQARMMMMGTAVLLGVVFLLWMMTAFAGKSKKKTTTTATPAEGATA